MRLIIIILFIFIYVELPAQINFKVEVINNSNGLSSDDVKFIFQDSDGCMWFGTEYGLNRYNGYDIEVYKGTMSSHGFKDVSFTCIEEDDNINIWIGTERGGVYTFNKSTKKITRIELNDSSKNVNAIIHLLFDTQQNMWIATQEGGLIKRNTITGEMIFYNALQDNPDSINHDVLDMIEDDNGRIWISTWENVLYVYHPKINKFITYNDPSFKIFSMLFDSKKNLWLGTWNHGLLKVDSISGSKIYYKRFQYDEKKENSISGNIIYKITEDEQNNIWIATPHGFDIIKQTANKTYRIKNFNTKNLNISSDEVLDIVHDNSGITWLSIIGNGINKIEKNRNDFQTIKIPDIDLQKRSQTVYSIYPSSDNSYYVGVKSLGFFEFNTHTKEFMSYTKLPQFKYINHNINSTLSFYADKRNGLWIGTRYGAIFYVNSNKNITRKISLDSISDKQAVFSITSDKNNNIWVGSNLGVYQIVYDHILNSAYIEQINSFRSLNEFYYGASINTIYCDSKNNIWIGSKYEGLIKYSETDSFKYYNNKLTGFNYIHSNNIASIYEDSRNRLWIGTIGGGIYLMNINEDKIISMFGIEDGLFGDAIYSIVESGSGEIWLGTNKGLSRFFPDKPIGEQFENYTTSDGLPSNIFMPNAVSKTAKNHLLFGSTNGIVMFDPQNISTNKYIPRSFISSILVDNKLLNTINNKKIILTHKDRFFTIEFEAYSYSQSHKNKFAYRLLGFNDDWIYTDSKNRKAYYNHLDPGEYVFQVKASNSSGLWNSIPTELNIKVLPAPYYTWWAICLYCIFGLIIIIGVYAIIIHSTRLQHKVKIQNIKQQFFVNVSHELLTPLSIISALSENIITKLKDDINIQLLVRNADRLKYLINQLLDFRKTETTTMKLCVSQYDLKKHLSNTISSFKVLADKKGYQYVSVFPENSVIAYFDSDKIDKIMHNLLSNAFKYTSPGGEIKVELKSLDLKKQDYCEIKVSDTGEGMSKKDLEHIFERFYRAGNQKAEGIGIGLALTKKLVDIHHGKIYVESEINKGTVFTIHLPISVSAYQKSEIGLKKTDNKSVNLSVEIPQKEHYISTNYKKDHNKSILIVEDNDDLRFIIMEQLNKYYNVFGAENGKVAFDILLENQPSVVISDIMMPDWDGIELCNKIKTTIETSHIPVILLTAKITEESRIEGYSYGADSYLTKPVNFEVLLARINSIIEQRERFKLFFQKNTNPSISEINLPSIDEKFVMDIQEIVSKNYQQYDFNREQFAGEMNMSVSLLYLKMKEITGLTPMNYLKKYRLQIAIPLLKKGLVIADIAVLTGFNSTRYFSTCFKEEYGVTPTEFIKNNSNLDIKRM